MYRTKIVIVFLFASSSLHSQSISNDGNYVTAKVNGSLIIQSTQNIWKKEVLKGSNVMFTPDNKQVIYIVGDS